MTSTANAIDEEWVEKKLKGANSSQDSVQSLSLWALNHKTQHEKIVGIWFKVLKAAKIDLRLTLFYLCNEVVQTCKRKHAIVFKDAFKEVLKDAALLVRDHSIRPNIERIFKIWEERHVYNKEFVDELMLILSNTKVKSTMSTKLMAEFKPEELVRQLKRVAEKEEHVEVKRLQLPEQQWDLLDVESFKQQSKDRHECGQYVDKVNGSRVQLESYVMDLQNEIQDRTILIQLLEESELFYEVQNSEANIVATAYKNFGSRVNTLHKKLHESRKPVKPLSPRILANSGSAAAKGKDSQSRRKEPDPGATPTEDEFDDDSCEGAMMNDSNQNFDSSDSSSESDEKKPESGARRNSREEQRSPEFSTDSVSGDAFSGLGSLLPNLFTGATTFLPSLASHGPQPTSADIHGFGLGAISNSIPPAADEDAGGATPVQDEEPNDDLPLRPMEFLKQVILDSTKSAARRPSTGSDHSHPFTSGHQVEMASSTTSMSSATSWPGYVPNFSQPESHLGEQRVVYESYDESYELIYPPGISQELSASMYDPERVHTFELYTSAYGDQTDASQAYMVEAVLPEGYPCAGDGFDIEGYPAAEPDYQGAYQEQLMSTVVDETYVDGDVVYSVATGESYHPSQHISGSYIGVLEHLPGVPPQPPPVVYRAMPSFTQPPPTFSHPPPSLAPSPSFSQPLPTLNQPTLTFITPSSFAGPPPSLTQPPPPLFTFPQNSTLPPMIPHPFVEPPPPSSYRLLSPASAKAALGLQSPGILISSPLESPSSVRAPYRQQTALKPWMKHPYNQFNNDLGGRGLAMIRETGRFDDVSEISSDSYRLGRGQPRTRRTNLTYLTEDQTNEDRNGKSGIDDHMAISSISKEEKSRYPSSALRSMSLPCGSFPFKSLPGDQDDRHQLSASPRSATISDALSKSQSFEALSDTLPVRTNSLDRDLRGFETDMMEISEVTQSDSGNLEPCTKNRHSDSGQLKQNATHAFSPTSSTACNIPSLGIPSSPRTFLTQRGTASRYPIRNCRPALSSVPALSSFRFRHDGARRFPRKPNFFAHRLPFQRNYPDGY